MVQVSDQLHNTTTSVIVNVLDDNDNAPVFTESGYEVNLYSAADVKVKVPLEVWYTHFQSLLAFSLPYKRWYQSYDVCLKMKRKDVRTVEWYIV